MNDANELLDTIYECFSATQVCARVAALARTHA
jgi:hypothetical protein